MNSKHLAIVFIVGLLFRVLVVLTLNNESAYQDEREYYQLAANLINGNGYSLDFKQPYQASLYREPGYPLFLASWLKIWQIFGNEVRPLTENQFFAGMCDRTLFGLPEFGFLKLSQAFIDALSVLFLMLTTSFAIKSRKLLLVYGFVFAMFLPSAYFATTLMRETWLTFLCSGFAYFFASYIYNNKIKDLLLFSLFFGLMGLTFQVMLLFGAAIVVYLMIFKKPFAALKASAVAATFTILISLPWLLFSYSQYPDMRIVKSWGTSLTHEKMDYVRAFRKLESAGLIPNDSLRTIYWSEFGNSPHDAFSKSFEGYYSAKTAEINRLLSNLPNDNAPPVWFSGIGAKLTNYVKAWFRPFSLKGIFNNEVKLKSDRLMQTLNLIFISFSAIMGILAFIGFALNIRKISPALIVFYTMFILIFLLGIGRRIQPIHGYFLLFFVLGIVNFGKYINERIHRI
jgi:hypothetical protein